MVIFDPIQVLSLEMREFMGRYLSTGNGLVDMIIGFCIFRFLMHVSTTAQRFSPASLIRSLLSIYPKRHKGEIEFSIEGQVNNIGHRVATFTPTYKAILHRVSMIDDERIWHMRRAFCRRRLKPLIGVAESVLCRMSHELAKKVCMK